MAEPTASECLFCRIVAGEIPCRRVYEDDRALAFLDIAPWHDGHTIVIPKRHCADVVVDGQALAEMAPAVSATAWLLKSKLGADAINVLSNAGEASGQEVFHAHVHVVPRYAAKPGLPAMTERDADPDLDATLARILG